MLERLRPRVAEAVDHALVHGVLKRTAVGGLEHAPFSLAPCPIHPQSHAALEALTPGFNRLVHGLARDPALLEEALGPIAAVDPFTADLLALARRYHATQPLYCQINRSDYFLQAGEATHPPAPRQVELNTISASYGGLSVGVSRTHAHLLRGTTWAAQHVPNDPLNGMAGVIAAAVARYGHPGAVVLEVVQADETNVFDQRLLEFALQALDVQPRRMTLEQIGETGHLREGHLVVNGEVAALTYFRAAYGPEDTGTEAARAARELIAASSTVAVPTVATQLAGTKKVQQVLSDPAVLARYCGEAEAVRLHSAFAAQHEPEQPVETANGTLPAWQAALADPGAWVLKPQREGGGHNFFGERLRERLEHMSAAERSAYILMERIRPLAHPAVLVREGRAEEAEAVSEIGRFGTFLADGEAELINRDAGYLVRTKPSGVEEGGVSAGFGFLSSLLLAAEPPV